MKSKKTYIIFILSLLILFKIEIVKASNQLEEFDMNNVKILETPFWCSMTDEQKAKAIDNLTEEQKRVALEDGTEKPFYNLYWNHKLCEACLWYGSDEVGRHDMMEDRAPPS